MTMKRNLSLRGYRRKRTRYPLIKVPRKKSQRDDREEGGKSGKRKNLRGARHKEMEVGFSGRNHKGIKRPTITRKEKRHAVTYSSWENLAKNLKKGHPR